MSGNSTYTKLPLTPEMADSGSDYLTFELNGGSARLARLLKAHLEKTGKTAVALEREAKLGSNALGPYARGQRTGITLGTMRKMAKALGMSAFKLGRVVFSKKAGTSSKKKKSAELGNLLSALGVDGSALACTFTIGDDQITVERMNGQEGRPVVVEHGGHRLTISKV